MTIYRSDAVRDAMLDALDTARGASVKIHIRTLTEDGTGGAGALLAELTGNAGGWAGASSGGVLTSSAITDDASADATGTALHYELLTSGSVWLESGDITITAGGGTMTLNSTDITETQTVNMSGDWVNTAAYDKDA